MSLIFKFLFLSLLATSFASDASNLTSNVQIVKKDGRIAGGVAVDITRFPYIVSIIYENSNLCGGAIISPKFVLTAAHCFFSGGQFVPSASSFKVRVGSRNNLNGGELIQVKRRVYLSAYDKIKFDLDIGLMELSRNIAFDGRTKDSIPLGGSVGSGVSVAVAGWGVNNENASQEFLRGVTLKSLSQSDCRNSMKGVTAGRAPVVITDNMLCATNPGKGSCGG